MIRLPFAPLEITAEKYLEREVTNVDLMHLLDLKSERTINKYRLFGLSVWAADRCAIAMSYHPIEVWGLEVWISAFEDAELDIDHHLYLVKMDHPEGHTEH